MANWGVVLARRPTLARKRRNQRSHPSLQPTNHVTSHATNGVTFSETDRFYEAAESDSPSFNRHGHVFKHLCQPEDGVEHDCYESGCERITINVSGLQFITRRSVLEAHPTTVLGNEEKRRPYYDSLREEYFFDRHRTTFEAIFNYYIYGGKLKRPQAVAEDVFLDECEFFEVEESVIKQYKKDEGYIENVYEYPSNPYLATIWALFEYPETSRLAFIIGCISVMATLVSIVTFTLETLPMFKKNCSGYHAIVEPHTPRTTAFNSTNSTQEQLAMLRRDFDYEKFFFIIETICNTWFTFEAVVRYIACPDKLFFWKDVKNIIDIIAILPYYVSLVQTLMPDDGEKCGSGNDQLAVLRVIRLIRVLKLAKHSEGIQILLLTFQSSMEGLTLFLLTLVVCVLVFSSMIYYCEIGEEDTQIRSIPGGFWWAVVTMCTVGYGDVVPVGTYGKLVGTVCALSGVLTLAIPVPIITENFNKFYVHKQRSKTKSSHQLDGGGLDEGRELALRLVNCCTKRKCDCDKGEVEDDDDIRDKKAERASL